MRCENCWVLKVKDEEIEQLKRQQKATLEIMQMAFTLVSLWEKANLLEPLDGASQEDVREERAYRKKQIRALFDDLVETGEFSFLKRLVRALNLPQNSEQFLE